MCHTNKLCCTPFLMSNLSPTTLDHLHMPLIGHCKYLLEVMLDIELTFWRCSFLLSQYVWSDSIAPASEEGQVELAEMGKMETISIRNFSLIRYSLYVVARQEHLQKSFETRESVRRSIILRLLNICRVIFSSRSLIDCIVPHCYT